MRARVVAAALALGAGCAAPAPSAGTAAPGDRPAPTSGRSPLPPKPVPARCTFEVRPPEKAPFVVEVRVRCDGVRVSAFVPDESELDAFVTRGELTEPAPGATELTYRVDLDAAAKKFDRFDLAARFGKSLVAPASSFLFTPESVPAGVPVAVRFDPANGFATGLRRNGDGHVLETHELRVATYTTFGAGELRTLAVPGVSLRVALLDGRLALGPDRVARWVESAYRAVAAFYEQAPDSEVLVVIAPLPKERGVRFGRLLPESAPGIVILVGEETTERDLVDDWMLVHELFHIGTPSYGEKSGWFDEGLATYFEPLIRARAGLTNEQKVWSEFAKEMPRGLEALTKYGLSAGNSRDDIYWGGGLFCLLADVETRRRTNGAKGLEDGLRAVLRAGGNSSEVWSLTDTFAAIDLAIGLPVLGELAKRHVEQGTPIDLDTLLRDLGVVVKGGSGAKRFASVRLDDKAPFAGVRRAVVQGRPW